MEGFVFETLHSTQPTIMSHQKGISLPLRNTGTGGLTLGIVASCSARDSCSLQHRQYLLSLTNTYIHWPEFGFLSHVFKCVIPHHYGIIVVNFACTMDRMKLMLDC
jgi:hypothetical protein